jgi:hypothetical protein
MVVLRGGGFLGNVTLRLGGWKNPLEQPRKWKVDIIQYKVDIIL